MIPKSICLWLVAAYLLVLTPGLHAEEKTPREEAQADTISSDVIIPGMVGKTFTDDLSGIRQRGILRALVSYSRTDFFLQGARPRGLFVELLNQYESFLNKGRKRNTPKTSIKYVPVTFDRLIPALLAGEGDIAGWPPDGHARPGAAHRFRQGRTREGRRTARDASAC